MLTSTFYELVINNLNFYLSILAISFIIYKVILIKIVDSLLEPTFFFVVFTNTICTANIILLYVKGYILEYSLFSYFISEFGLLAGLLFCSKTYAGYSKYTISPDFKMYINNGIYISFLLMVISTIAIYFIRGVPIFLPSRGDASGGGSGFGLFLRVSQVSSALFVIIYFIRRKINKSKIDNLMFFISILFGILSGLKTYIIFYMYVYFIISRDYLDLKFKSKFFLGAIIFSSVILTFILSSDDLDINTLFNAILSRICASGDIYYLGLVNNAIENLDSPVGFLNQHFGGILASLKIIPWESAPFNYGLEINRVVNGNDANIGPTFRYNMLILLFTDSVFIISLYSFLIGIVIGLSRRFAYNSLHYSVKFIFYSLLYFKTFELILGPDNAINSILFYSLILIIILYMIRISLKFARFKIV